MKRIAVLCLAATVSSFASAVVIMDQIGANPADVSATGTAASQDFETSLDAYDIGVLDNFNTTAQTTITSVDAFMGGWNGFTSFTNILFYRVEIFSSVAAAASSLTGDVGSATVGVGSAIVNTGYTGETASALVTLPVNIVVPTAGTYFVSVMGRMDFTPNGQVGIRGSNYAGAFPGGTDAMQANPGGGFQQGTSFPTNSMAAYRIEGSVVPEPTTMAGLGLALVALARRRRK
ncbi:MAG: PEP-CTERM sorting domain-containing protein [Fimbriimonadaceae bacterium]|uniref:Ice-binding protein C-terminal domain-containing protein n=1 Tax=Candidatus Nitrosymbiomonas proteolyticus TaxID=2608984 RepID=A0A809SCP7_9BACT|nr:PEP-CTERM sorting domain-containing protein [Nitrospira sp.]MCK6632241.1 PEP-CTERM sorting domain-containing protein [Fimbriimonadaceae bacterium]NUM38913.1 PEP-CTERM sorting domain-containing protein [Armatimonadota bacterium]BBO22434.1 conserved hypothetical protein [Candidatus Nitrosymbiomonas proteolyticus]